MRIFLFIESAMVKDEKNVEPLVSIIKIEPEEFQAALLIPRSRQEKDDILRSTWNMWVKFENNAKSNFTEFLSEFQTQQFFWTDLWLKLKKLGVQFLISESEQLSNLHFPLTLALFVGKSCQIVLD